ncbi:hypothetical protein HBI56_168320 [Parastagonospora nodorum]|uniref:Uncharacterized protein n=1 Tax=Phaeosphaeria nodorum (strain SN15 / ATCC MYA-4574 / FGSC 10173) TaxID=321614 RepID=A0A7U2I6T8_PHANO|nr:hypothetical protein HBH56_050420 [Parastagonospora nodorum]QRD02062.1 hypothetical protein JI435_303520 [Parastagonospora nodorum SN15]KAH3935979.1 hypothetical protein HBH54_036210 [Parastagonospora nodorum]KAH3942671.1 hypothetical protein HBH53_183750 [Parastagonospora nodorum]KAH3964210.1 hypothetical protein HBH51_162080 [Parastagonospora nodorum]
MLYSAPLVLIMAMATGANAACRRGLNSYPNYSVGCITDDGGTVCRSEQLPGGSKGCTYPTAQNLCKTDGRCIYQLCCPF